MIETYQGRRIVIIPTRRDGFPAHRVRINGVEHWIYPAYQYATIAIVLARIKADLDAVDARQEPAYGSYMYRKGDWRQLAVLAAELGE